MTADLRRLAEQATPGPWHAPNPPDGVGEGMLYADDGWAIVDSFVFANEERRNATRDWRVPFTRPDGQHQRDAAYIAAANPQAILALLDRVEFAEGVLSDAYVRHGEPDTLPRAQARAAAAERRVAALEDGLRDLMDCWDRGLLDTDYDRIASSFDSARALLTAASDQEVAGADPAPSERHRVKRGITDDDDDSCAVCGERWPCPAALTSASAEAEVLPAEVEE